MRKPALIIFSLFLVVACCFPQNSTVGSVRGEVLTMDATGTAVVPEAQIQIQGPVSKETRSDAAGSYHRYGSGFERFHGGHSNRWIDDRGFVESGTAGRLQ